MLTVTATLQETPPDHRGGYRLATDEVSAEAEDYSEALEAANRRVPDGWRVLFVRVDRPSSS